MNREEQIKEMHLELEKWDDADTKLSLSEWLYNAGYRKQSAWISVEDKLPDLEPLRIKWGTCGYKQKSARVLCACVQESGKVLVKEGYCEAWEDDPTSPSWKIPGTIDSVTHWMPLPEPPVTKGGESHV